MSPVPTIETIAHGGLVVVVGLAGAAVVEELARRVHAGMLARVIYWTRR